MARDSGMPFTILNYEPAARIRHGDHSFDGHVADALPYNINLIHINPYDLPLAVLQMGKSALDRRYNIAFWLWELEDFPSEWERAIDFVDEIWAPSEFAASSFRKATGKPVLAIPYGLSVAADRAFDRAYFGLPEDRCIFLCMYDSSSTAERKNPLGAIRAFKQAFSRGEPGVWLVVKVNNPTDRDAALIRGVLGGYDNVTLIAKTLAKPQIDALIADCDVLVSLHRAEGFGLPPAEAMLLGTAVIATNWSSTVEFMPRGTACLVDCELVEIVQAAGPYPKGARWAEPDTAQAAGYMRRLSEDPGYRREIAASAKARIAALLSPQRAAAAVCGRVNEIYREANGTK
jgi:glycosyltransferase involved in cell wall biosynthesis